MTLTTIAIFAGAALLYSLVCPGRWRGWTLFILSVFAVFWLGSALTIHHLDFVLPTVTLALTALIWLFTRPADAAMAREDWIALGVMALMVIGLSATRYLIADLRPTPSRAPDIPFVLLLLAILGGLIALVWRVSGGRRGALTGLIIFILLIFVVLKAEPLTILASQWLRTLSGQNPDLARVGDIAWLGFSYIAFRLIHLLRDRQIGTLPALSLREAMTFTLFFPALIAGPIDRAERFVKDDRALAGLTGLDAGRLTEGATRIFVGIAKKFIIADTLALIALNATNAEQITSSGVGWVLLYAYAFRLFFDFSGYTDIAIGIGILFGIWLPENFKRPYLKNNITTFWQSWHITLSNWARFYVFSPLTRFLLTRKQKPSPYVVVFITQMATMIAIALWHGITWTFLVWGVWHGVGLFLHKVWSDRTRKWYLSLRDKPRTKLAWTVVGVVLTFHYVVLGWVWFALPDITTAARVFAGLFGIGA